MWACVVNLAVQITILNNYFYDPNDKLLKYLYNNISIKYCVNDRQLSTTLHGYQFILAASRPQPWKAYNRPNFTILIMKTPRSKLVSKKALTTTTTTTLCPKSDQFGADMHYINSYSTTVKLYYTYMLCFLSLAFHQVFRRRSFLLYLLHLIEAQWAGFRNFLINIHNI